MSCRDRCGQCIDAATIPTHSSNEVAGQLLIRLKQLCGMRRRREKFDPDGYED